MNSLDSKIVQYTYAISKLQAFISSLRRLSSRENIKDLPLLQYIVLLTGNVFSINDTLFNPRLDLLSNFKLFKNTPITISSVVNHVPYDTGDLEVTSLAELPNVDKANKCLKLLESLCFNCLQAYQKRLQQAKVERAAQNPVTEVPSPTSPTSPTSDFYSKLEEIIKTEILNSATDLDLNLKDSKVLLNLPSNQNLLNNEDFIEATLIDMDIRMLYAMNSSISQTLERLRELIQQYLLIKKSSQPEKQLVSLEQLQDGTDSTQSFTMHRICALAIRLNELYIIFRKIGRKVYFSNYEHLHDSKLHFQSKNQTYFKSHLLKDIDEMFNTTRKNGTLIATLTRFFRQGAHFETNVKNVNDFMNFINQGFMMIDGCLVKSEEFAILWLSSELRFRKVYGLPKKILTDLYNEENPAPPPSESPSSESKVTSSNISSDTNVTNDLSNLNLDSDSSSRSSSITSQSSLPSVTTPSKPLTRRSNRHSMIISPSKDLNGGVNSPGSNASPNRVGSFSSPTRPQSMIFMNNNSSLTTLPSQKSSTLQQRLAAESNNNNTPINTNSSISTMAGRRRSNSQPIKPSEKIVPTITLSPSAAAASGAASALKNNFNRSPSGSIKRNGSVSRSSPTPKQLISVEEEKPPSKNEGPAPLTANQRLQQHLKQAARQGALMTQQKEVFSSVVFDPNSPSSVNLRPQRPPQLQLQEPQPQTQLQPKSPSPDKLSPPPTFPQTVSPVPKTRDQVTRINTRRNSVSQPFPSTSSVSSISTSDSGSTSTPNTQQGDSVSIKKVRFTGVPEYTAAEDAPTSYSSRILKNFAVFKTPATITKPAFKRKDQLFKKEESISFKTQLHNPMPTENGNGIGAPPPTIKTNFGTEKTSLSKLKSKLI